MPRFFFNVHDDHALLDDTGTDFPNIAAAKAHVPRFVGELIRDSEATFWDCDMWRLEVTDEIGLVLFVVHVSAAVSPAMQYHH